VDSRIVLFTLLQRRRKQKANFRGIRLAMDCRGYGPEKLGGEPARTVELSGGRYSRWRAAEAETRGGIESVMARGMADEAVKAQLVRWGRDAACEARIESIGICGDLWRGAGCAMPWVARGAM